MKKHKKKISPMGILALGFFGIIIVGALLLCLPFATKEGLNTNFLDALFTATSATCVTGLVIVDTYQHWTLFGQIVIMVLIQIGGLGFITIGVYIAVLLKKKIGIKGREAIHESVSTMEVAGVVRLTKRIVKGTLLMELIGAILLSIRFIPQKGFLTGIYYGMFHSVSAFCNAGFDLNGDTKAYSSFVDYKGDILVNLTIMALIIIGGIGFIVWDDIYRNKWHFRKYLLHTKIVLLATTILVFGGAVLFFIIENGALFKDMTGTEKVLSSLFSSVTARTAGFNTVDTVGLSHASKLLTMILMFIGGSAGSTAGGIKTTTIVVVLCFAWAMIRKTQGTNIFGRRLEEETVKKANGVIVIHVTLSIIAVMIIFINQTIGFEDALFEVISAIGTVGMSTGITRDLTSISRIALIVLMYCGRIGSLSFAITFAQKKIVVPVQQPVEKIVVG